MKSQTSLPEIKDKQLEILILLYKFRFLNRTQIQKMLNHKYFNTIILWLNDLTNKKYIVREFNKKFASQPSVYFLDKLSIIKLKGRDGIKNNLLAKVYKSKTLTQRFRRHCMFLADIYLSLLDLTKNSNAKLHYYTKTQINGMRYMILPEPDAYFAIEDAKKNIKRYFLDVFDYPAPKVELKKRVEQYFNYYEENYWQDNTGHPFPEVIMVCPDIRSKINLTKIVKDYLSSEWSEILFYVTTWDEIKHKGVNKNILHRVKANS